MKHPARWLIALALLVCALAWWWNRPPPEPMYQGEPLSQWMLEARSNRYAEFGLVGDELRSIGPQTVKWLTYTAEHGHVTHRKPGIIETILAKLRGRDSVAEWPPDYDQRAHALWMLGEMGAAAAPAIPTLARALNSEMYDHVQSAAGALHQIGPASWPVVEDQLVHGPNLVRCGLISTIWWRVERRRGPVSEDTVQKVFGLLAQALQDSEPDVRRNAADSLSRCINETVSGPLVDRAALALWPLPDDSNRVVRDAKGKVLIYYQNTKAEAVPRLTAMLADADPAKRGFARSALDGLSVH